MATIRRLEEPDLNGSFYVDFDTSLTLREIIVGSDCKKSVGSFAKLITPVNADVTVIKVRSAFESFTMVRQKRVSPIVVHPKPKNA
jgi:hypothetical protein